jgi:hypothetical protein
MNHIDKIDLIERYHQHKLTADEQQHIAQLMQTDLDFANEVEDYCCLLQGFDMLHLENFAAQLQCFEQAAKQQEQHQHEAPMTIAQPSTTLKAQKGGAWFNWRNMAASIAFLVFIPLAYFALMGQASLFDEHFLPTSASLAEGPHRGATDALTPEGKARQEALTTYDTRKNYAEALPLLQKYADTYGKSNQIQLYIGVSQLYLNQLDQAITSLQTVINSTEAKKQDEHQEAEFMLALAYLRKQNYTECKLVLDKIKANNYHNYKKQADKLAAELPK